MKDQHVLSEEYVLKVCKFIYPEGSNYYVEKIGQYFQWKLGYKDLLHEEVELPEFIIKHLASLFVLNNILCDKIDEIERRYPTEEWG